MVDRLFEGILCNVIYIRGMLCQNILIFPTGTFAVNYDLCIYAQFCVYANLAAARGRLTSVAH